MSNLIDLYEKLAANYKSYLTTHSLEFLIENIELFKKIKLNKLKDCLKKSSEEDIYKYNRSLQIIVECYFNYAVKNINNKAEPFLTGTLKQAARCNSLITNAIENIPSHRITTQLSEQNTKANFYHYKIRFYLARVQLILVKQQIDNTSPNSKTLIKKLTHLLKEYTIFQKQLNNRYKDTTLRQKLGINNELVNTVEKGIKQLKLLLKNASVPPAIPMEQSLNEINDQSIETAKESVEASISSFEATTFSSPVISQARNAFFQAPTPIYIKSNKRFADLLSQWENSFCDEEILDMARKAIVLQQIAHVFLLVAVYLKQHNNNEFYAKNTNPVLRLAIHVFLIATEIGAKTNNQAVNNLQYSSKKHAKLLKHFIEPSRRIAPIDFLGYLRNKTELQKTFDIQLKSPDRQELIDKAFAILATHCSKKTYALVKEKCAESLKHAYERCEVNKIGSQQSG